MLVAEVVAVVRTFDDSNTNQISVSAVDGCRFFRTSQFNVKLAREYKCRWALSAKIIRNKCREDPRVVNSLIKVAGSQTLRHRPESFTTHFKFPRLKDVVWLRDHAIRDMGNELGLILDEMPLVVLT